MNNYRSVLRNNINGRHTYRSRSSDGYDVAISQSHQANTWSATENSSNNSWNVNFSDGNANNNNKNNSNVVRPVTASIDSEWDNRLAFSRKCKDTVPQYFINSFREAYYDCCRGKNMSTQCMDYKPMADIDLPILAWEVWTDNYTPSTSTCFLVKYPKWREVFAANFRDRIVHHWIHLKLNPLFESRFVSQGNVSFNCRKGYGTQKAVNNVYDGIKRVTNNYQREAWIFKGDLVSCFMSIDKNIMWRLIGRFIVRKYHGVDKEILLRLVRIVVFHNPNTNCILNSNPEWWKNLPTRKSLFRTAKGKGLPIGNLPTQIFTNFMLSFFDSYVQFIFRGIAYSYTRFVDDFVIVCDNAYKLKHSIPQMRYFLKKVLLMELHTNKHYFQKASHGVLFVGSYIKNNRIYLSNRTIARMKEKVHGFVAMMEHKELATADCARIASVLNSYLGFTRQCQTYRIRKSMMDELLASQHFSQYFYVQGHYQVIKIKNKYKSFIPSLC